MDASGKSTTSKRSYHSQVRQQQAEDTRQRILLAARELLARRGYAGMTIDSIADAAKVSPKTVTAIFGAKRDIVAALVHPDMFDTPIQQLLEQLRALQAPRERIALIVRISAQVFASLPVEFELLRTAGVVAPELAEISKLIDQRRRQRQSYAIWEMADRGQLHPALSPEVALDLIWSLTSYDVYHRFVSDAHWSTDQFIHWLTTLLLQQLLPAQFT